MNKYPLLICGILCLSYFQVSSSYSKNIDNSNYLLDFEKDFYDFGLTKEEVDDFMEIFEIIDQKYIDNLNQY